MADSNVTLSNTAPGANCFKEAVCVNAGRIYDSCSSEHEASSETSAGNSFRVRTRRNPPGFQGSFL